MANLGNNTSGHFFDTSFNTQGVLYSDGSGVITSTSSGSSGQLLQSAGNGSPPAYTTATYPATAGTSANILQSDGTNVTSTNLVQTYVPTTVGSSTAGTQSYTTQQGRWIQFGGMVIVQFDCIGTYGGTAAGNIRLNLPATAANIASINNWGCGLCINNTNRTGVWQVTQGTAFATFANNAGTLENVSAANTFNLQGTICYFVA